MIFNPSEYMECRSWHSVAREHGAILRPDMQKGKVYLHQLFTTCFVEFETLEAAQEFRKYADQNLLYWDYDPVATIDTNRSEVVESWANHMA